MTDSPARGGKRARLVASALDLLYRQGVARTTLADVAEAADVPIGNVYYYFKTKDALVEAVIDAHADSLRAMFASFERHHDPRARLRHSFAHGRRPVSTWPAMAARTEASARN